MSDASDTSWAVQPNSSNRQVEVVLVLPRLAWARAGHLGWPHETALERQGGVNAAYLPRELLGAVLKIYELVALERGWCQKRSYWWLAQRNVLRLLWCDPRLLPATRQVLQELLEEPTGRHDQRLMDALCDLLEEQDHPAIRRKSILATWREDRRTRQENANRRQLKHAHENCPADPAGDL